MMPFIAAMWNKFAGYVIIAATVGATFVTVYFKGRSDANSKNRQDVLEDDLRSRRIAGEVRRAADLANDPLKQLRQRWERDRR